MPYNSKAVANWFLDRAAKDQVPLSPMKLQKLIYFAHGWALAVLGMPLIDEHPEAWDYGPVIPSIYHEFKSFGRDSITKHATRLEFSGSEKDGFAAEFVAPKIPESEGQINEFLERVWQVYGSLSGIQLSNMTHVSGGAWEKAYASARDKKGTDIPDDLIKDEFIAKMNAPANG